MGFLREFLLGDGSFYIGRLVKKARRFVFLKSNIDQYFFLFQECLRRLTIHHTTELQHRTKRSRVNENNFDQC